MSRHFKGNHKKRKNRAAGFLVLENPQTNQTNIAHPNSFDIGITKRKKNPELAKKSIEYRKKYKAKTPSKRISFSLSTSTIRREFGFLKLYQSLQTWVSKTQLGNFVASVFSKKKKPNG